MNTSKLITLSLFTSISLFAAPPTMPNIGDALQQVKPPKLKKEEKVLPSIKGADEIELKEFDESKRVFINKISVEGVTSLDKRTIRDIVSPYEKRELSFGDVQDLTTKITRAYRSKGYFVARAYIPEQNIHKQENKLRVVVVEGAYGEFELQNNSLVKDSIIQANLDDIKDTKSYLQKR